MNKLLDILTEFLAVLASTAIIISFIVVICHVIKNRKDFF